MKQSIKVIEKTHEENKAHYVAQNLRETLGIHLSEMSDDQVISEFSDTYYYAIYALKYDWNQLVQAIAKPVGESWLGRMIIKAINFIVYSLTKLLRLN